MNTTIYRTIKMKPIEVKDNTYNVVQKRCLVFFSSQSCVLQFFSYLSGDADSRPGKLFTTNMDPTGRYTTQKRIKIIKQYFAPTQFFWHINNAGNILAGKMYLIEEQHCLA